MVSTHYEKLLAIGEYKNHIICCCMYDIGEYPVEWGGRDTGWSHSYVGYRRT